MSEFPTVFPTKHERAGLAYAWNIERQRAEMNEILSRQSSAMEQAERHLGLARELIKEVARDVRKAVTRGDLCSETPLVRMFERARDVKDLPSAEEFLKEQPIIRAAMELMTNINEPGYTIEVCASQYLMSSRYPVHHRQVQTDQPDQYIPAMVIRVTWKD